MSYHKHAPHTPRGEVCNVHVFLIGPGVSPRRTVCVTAVEVRLCSLILYVHVHVDLASLCRIPPMLIRSTFAATLPRTIDDLSNEFQLRKHIIFLLPEQVCFLFYFINSSSIATRLHMALVKVTENTREALQYQRKQEKK